jgi:hypothetical protein
MRKLSTSTWVDKENRKIDKFYGAFLDKEMKRLENQNSASITSCLHKHKITPNLRARMIDWMIEVLSNFKCEKQTFFLAVNLMDRYFKNVAHSLEVHDLHSIGVTSMLIASKYEDIYPLKMKIIYEKIAHKKLEIEQIKKNERDMLKALDFKVAYPSCWDFLAQYLTKVIKNHSH